MNEKLFLFFSELIGNTMINGHEYAFCYPMNLEINEKRDVIVACTVVDKEGNFYDLWLSWEDFVKDNWDNRVIKRIGKYKELPLKNIAGIIFYLERRGIL